MNVDEWKLCLIFNGDLWGCLELSWSVHDAYHWHQLYKSQQIPVHHFNGCLFHLVSCYFFAVFNIDNHQEIYKDEQLDILRAFEYKEEHSDILTVFEHQNILIDHFMR